MPSIAVIDDRFDYRETLQRMMALYVPKGWEVIDSAPLEDLARYPSWIHENEVATFVIDERLQEQALDAQGHATYDGHQLVDFLRPRLPSLPIFFVTSYSDEAEVKDRLGKVEGIIGRNEFMQRANDFVDRFVRSGQRYLEVHQAELAELAELSGLVAEGRGTENDTARMRAIREKLGLAFQASETLDRPEWVLEMSRQLNELERLRDEIENFLGKQR